MEHDRVADDRANGQADPGDTHDPTFGYASGAAYSVLLNAFSPGWTRRLKSTDDLGDLVTAAAGITASANADAAAKSYGSDELKAAEEKRDTEQKARMPS